MKATLVILACAFLAAQVNAQDGSGSPVTPGTPPQGPPPSQGPPSPPTPPASPPPQTPPATTPAAQPPAARPPASQPPAAQPPAAPRSPPPPGTTPSPTNQATNSVGGVPNATPTSQATVAGSPTDADILYFAYNLEVFEAQFYSCATTGQPIPSQYLGGGPAPTGCQRANLTSNVGTYGAELAREELAHVVLLYNALRTAGVNVQSPAIDISVTPFNAAAQVATGQQNLNPPFNPYANDYFFLHAAFLFEDVGVSAYLGALNSISNSSYRLTGAQIGATEAYHASLIRTLLYQQIDVTPAYGLTIRQITDGITAATNTLAQQPQIKYGIYNQQGAAISNVDSNGLVPGASAQQVLRVVTLGAPAGSGGGFFPNNLNGNVKN